MDITLFKDMQSNLKIKKKKVVQIKSESVVERPLPPTPLVVEEFKEEALVVEEFKEEDVVE